MNKYFLAALLCGGSLICALPSLAIIGEDAGLLKSYFNGPKGVPRQALEKRGQMERFAKVRIEARPQSVFFYPDKNGKVQREYWLAPPGDMWKLEQADKIRDAVMMGRSPISAQLENLRGMTFNYADGSHVYYRMVRGMVYSLLAVDKSFNPGERSHSVPRYYEYDRIIKPHS